MADTDRPQDRRAAPEPVPVTIAAPEVVPVEIVGDVPTPHPPSMRVQSQKLDPSLPANTTFEQNLTTASQRRVNLKWEGTQQTIAIEITTASLLVCVYIIVWGPETLRQAAFIFMTNIAFLVIGTYFQRTNHTKTGGVGPNELGR